MLINTIQKLLQEQHLPAWLIYDFRNQNPVATNLLGLEGHYTRRWFLFVPATGQATLIHHRIEQSNWETQLVGENLRRIAFSGHQELEAALRETLHGIGSVAMEYSPRGAVPMVSRVDAGTLELVRETGGVTITSSENLSQHFLRLDAEDLAAHRRAVAGCIAAKDAAFALAHQRLCNNATITELELQDTISQVLHAHHLEFDHPAIVGVAGHAGNPHYAPTPSTDRALQRGQCLLIDLWGGEPNKPQADITWMGFAGQPDAAFMRLWQLVSGARDAAIKKLQHHNKTLQGYAVDDASRAIIVAGGHGADFTHRTGHHLGRNITHGPGVNLDNLETHDTRLLLPGLLVTVEPGIYLPDVGVRSEVDVLMTDDSAEVTTPIQRGPYRLGEGEMVEVLG